MVYWKEANLLHGDHLGVRMNGNDWCFSPRSCSAELSGTPTANNDVLRMKHVPWSLRRKDVANTHGVLVH